MVCERCEEKYWNNKLLKCNRCGRLQTKLDFDIFIGKNVCYCIRNNEDLEEKELPLLNKPVCFLQKTNKCSARTTK